MALRPQNGIDAASQRIQNVAAPTVAADGANKLYVDTRVASTPSYVTTGRPYVFDPVHSIYNLTSPSAHRIHALMASSWSRRVRVGMIGHSEVAGTKATIGSTDGGIQLRRRITNLGYPATTGVVWLQNNTGQGPDSRYTTVSGFTSNSGLPFYTASSVGATVTFVSDLPGTAVDIYTYNSSAAFTVTIDGVSYGSVTGAGGTLAPQVASFTGLVNVSHTVTVTTTSTSNVYLAAIGVRSATAGVEIANGGQGASLASDWLPSAGPVGANDFGTMVATAPDLVTVQLDANEALQGVAPATFKSNMQTILSQLQTNGTPFALVASPSMTPGGNSYNAVSDAQWFAIVNVIYDLADQYNVPLLDLTYRFVSQATANTDGLMGDQVHPNGSGYSVVSELLTYLLTNGVAPSGARSTLNVAVSRVNPNLTQPGLWVQLDQAGNPVTMWLENGVGL